MSIERMCVFFSLFVFLLCFHHPAPQLQTSYRPSPSVYAHLFFVGGHTTTLVDLVVLAAPYRLLIQHIFYVYLPTPNLQKVQLLPPTPPSHPVTFSPGSLIPYELPVCLCVCVHVCMCTSVHVCLSYLPPFPKEKYKYIQ